MLLPTHPVSGNRFEYRGGVSVDLFDVLDGFDDVPRGRVFKLVVHQQSAVAADSEEVGVAGEHDLAVLLCV